MDKRTIGTKYEQFATQYLIKQGAYIIETNYHFHKMGEIDIIYFDNVIENGKTVKYLCFGEVKYRKKNNLYNAEYAVDFPKRKRISNTAYGYIKERNISPDHPMRFDIIAIDGDCINWIKNAFYPVS